MAITISVNPADKSAVYRPVIFEAVSNRALQYVYGGVSGITSGTGGKARYTLSPAPTNLIVGDILTVSGCTGAATVYNVRQTLTVKGIGYIETDLDYSVAMAGTPVITRTNDNFKLKGSIYAFDQAKKTITAVANYASGAYPGAKIEITCAAHGYSVGDVALQEGTTDYNGSAIVRYVTAANKYVVAGTYTSTQTGTTRKGTFIGSKRIGAITIASVLTFRFNVANLLQSALSKDILALGASNIQTPNTNSIKWYSLLLVEEFDDVDGTVKAMDSLDGEDIILTTVKQAVRGSLKHTDTQSLAAFIMGSSTKRFLSNAPTTRRIRVGEEDQLSFLANIGVTGWNVSFTPYNLSGISLGESFLPSVDIIDGRGIIPVNSSMFNAAHSKVLVRLSDGVSFLSETITYLIDPSTCSAVRIVFENYMGGFDAFTFTGSNRRSNSVDRTSFKKDLGISFSVSDRGDTALGTVAETGFEAFSRFLTRAEGIWLEEMLNTVNVYVVEGGSLIPISILNNNDPTDDTDGPAQLKLQYKYANAPITLSN